MFFIDIIDILNRWKGPGLKSAERILTLTAVLILCAGCGAHGSASSTTDLTPAGSPDKGRVETSGASSPDPSVSPSATFEQESADVINNCRPLKKLRLTVIPDGVRNPCAQAGKLAELFLANKRGEFDAEGFSIQVGGLRPNGVRILVDGDVDRARQMFSNDPLIGDVRSEKQGF